MTPADQTNDERWMARAVAVARKGWGDTHPNPVVGAVLADGDRLLSEGFHARAGAAHAEVEALRGFPGEIPASATLYITLEPCSTQGRTPPCTRAILDRGIRRVVAGALDDDPRHRGRGIDVLREAGVDAAAGVLEAECRDLNLIFHFLHATGRPLVAAKTATSIDGRTATASGASKWITGEAARRDVHRWRRYFPAVGAGAGTVLADDPALTARCGGGGEHCPARIVFDRGGRVAGAAGRRVFTDRFRGRTTVLVSEEHARRVRSALPEEVGVVTAPRGPEFAEFLRSWLRAREYFGLYVEGGGSLHGDLFAARLIDYFFAYRAPKLFLDDKARPLARGRSPADPSRALSLVDCRHEFFEGDQLLRGFVRYPDSD
ncbi:MAG: bifunctional diaminohydroxyphosphoribosylaminopyrimidine deaminase/5-amino-6-(5-phosphoribosylamino)uracil reductase RibD [Puniceicoccaceae bacterium]